MTSSEMSNDYQISVASVAEKNFGMEGKLISSSDGTSAVQYIKTIDMSKGCYCALTDN